MACGAHPEPEQAKDLFPQSVRADVDAELAHDRVCVHRRSGVLQTRTVRLLDLQDETGQKSSDASEPEAAVGPLGRYLGLQVSVGWRR